MQNRRYLRARRHTARYVLPTILDGQKQATTTPLPIFGARNISRAEPRGLPGVPK